MRRDSRFSERWSQLLTVYSKKFTTLVSVKLWSGICWVCWTCSASPAQVRPSRKDQLHMYIDTYL